MQIKSVELEYKFHNISEISNIQNMLSDISSDNINEIHDAVIPFLQNDVSAHQFFLSLKNIVIFRPLQIQSYCQLLATLSSPLKQISNQQFQRKIIVMFKNELKILLTLYELGIIDIDNIIDNSLCPFESNVDLKKYFYPEIAESKPDYFLRYRRHKGMFMFLTQNLDGGTDHKEKRGKFMNENLICQFIINDDLESFIDYLNHNIIDLNSPIPVSLFETTSYVSTFSESGMHYIEYAAFYGALKIFKYMIQNDFTIFPKTMNAAIVGGNYEIIHLLEDMNISMSNDCFYDAVKSHRNEIVNYIIDNYSNISLNIDFLNNTILFYNLEFIMNTVEFLVSDEFVRTDDSNFLNESLFISCEKNFCEIFEFLLSFDNFMNINFKYKLFYDMTLLHKAALSHHIEIVKILLNKKGINTELTDIKISFFTF